MLLETSKEEIVKVVGILREKEEKIDEDSPMRLIIYGFYTNRPGTVNSGGGNSNYLKICMPPWATGGNAGQTFYAWRKENLEH